MKIKQLVSNTDHTQRVVLFNEDGVHSFYEVLDIKSYALCEEEHPSRKDDVYEFLSPVVWDNSVPGLVVVEEMCASNGTSVIGLTYKDNVNKVIEEHKEQNKDKDQLNWEVMNNEM